MKRIFIGLMVLMSSCIFTTPSFCVTESEALKERCKLVVDADVVKIERSERYFESSNGDSYGKVCVDEIYLRVRSIDMPDNFYKTHPFTHKWLYKHSNMLEVVVSDSPSPHVQSTGEDYSDLPKYMRVLSEVKTSWLKKPKKKIRIKAKMFMAVRRHNKILDFSKNTGNCELWIDLYADSVIKFECK